MNRVFTCIICPNGCEITATYEGKELLRCEGNLCRRGEEYVRQELSDPRRTIASSVRIEGGELPLVSVRLNAPIPREKIPQVMEVIRGLRVKAPVSVGQVLAADVLGLGADIIVTCPVREEGRGV